MRCFPKHKVHICHAAHILSEMLVTHICHASYLPLTDVLVKLRGITKHVTHTCHLTHPSMSWYLCHLLVEVRCISKHTIHIGHITHNPAADVFIEGFSIRKCSLRICGLPLDLSSSTASSTRNSEMRTSNNQSFCGLRTRRNANRGSVPS